MSSDEIEFPNRINLRAAPRTGPKWEFMKTSYYRNVNSWTAECPLCHKDATWTQNPEEQSARITCTCSEAE